MLTFDRMTRTVHHDGAPVPAIALVTCVHCGRRLRLADADLVGLGYRCGPCSVQADLDEAEGRSDIVDHFGPAEQELRLRRARGTLAIGLGMLALAVLAPVVVALTSRVDAISMIFYELWYGTPIVGLTLGAGVSDYLRYRRPALPEARARLRLPAARGE